MTKQLLIVSLQLLIKQQIYNIQYFNTNPHPAIKFIRNKQLKKTKTAHNPNISIPNKKKDKILSCKITNYQMSLKQQYLAQCSPFPFNFEEQRAATLTRIMELIQSIPPNLWNIHALDPLSILQSYKQVYGLHSHQLVNMILYMFEHLTSQVKNNNYLTCEASIHIFKILLTLAEYRIDMSGLQGKIDNLWFINRIKEIIQFGLPYALKNSDSYMQNLIKIIKIYCKYGKQYYKQILAIAIEERDIKYLAIFIKSIKSASSSNNLLHHIFEQSSIFERDTNFFHIIAQLTLNSTTCFEPVGEDNIHCLASENQQHINLSPYIYTLSQEIIKSITSIIDPSTEDDLKKLNSEDPLSGVPCILKSIARILVNILRPIHGDPYSQKSTVNGNENKNQQNKQANNNGNPASKINRGWSCIQRIFSLIRGLIDHTHQVQSMNDFLIFIKQFVKVFIARYRKQRGLYKQINQDYVQQFHLEPSSKIVFTQSYITLFNQLFLPLIPQLLYLQDGQVQAAKILSDLAMFLPQYLPLILQQIKLYLLKDLTLNSTYTPKMTILFLQEYIINNYLDKPQFMLLVQCSQLLIDALQKLGIAENLDILELVMRVYMYLPQGLEENGRIKALTDDIIDIIQVNLDAMSINLQNTQGEQAQLYTDFKNIYFNFIIRLDQEHIGAMCDKMLYKIGNMVPQHRQAYQFILISLSFINPSFAKKVLDLIFKNMIATVTQKSQGKTEQKSPSLQLSIQLFPLHSTSRLTTHNQQQLRWYSSILQCIFQYNPENVVANWQKLQTIIMLMLRETDNSSIFDWGLDLLFNVIINLGHVHLEPKQFWKNANRDYKTLKTVNWKHPTVQAITLLEYIKKTFYDQVIDFMHKRYEATISQSQTSQKIQSQRIIQIIFDKSETSVGPKPIQVRQFINQIIDCLLVPSIPSPEDIQQKKYINKMLSIQYSVFSALQMRSVFTSNQDMFQIEGYFIRELGCMRKSAIQHLKWVLQLLGHYNCLYDPTLLKLFHFYWREAHDQLYFSTGIEATNQKLNPYFYPTIFKKKQLFQNPFLIMTECYVTFMMRIQLFSMLLPMAHLNNPQYLQYLVPLSFSSILQCNPKSYIPMSIDPHLNYHFQIVNICRLKLSLFNANSYIRKSIVYSKAGSQGLNKIQKQKYVNAIRILISNYKRNMAVFSYACCVKDEATWYAIQQTLEITQYLEKKNDKIGIIQIIYLLIVFSFDFKGSNIYGEKYRMVDLDKGKITLDQQGQMMKNRVVSFVRFLMEKINGEIVKKFYQKDATVLVLLLVCYSEFIPLNHQIYLELIPLIIVITSKNTEDMMNMGKSFLFRILNRYIKKRTEITVIQNTSVKRNFEDFLVYRHIGGLVNSQSSQKQPPSNLITSKSDNYYYPLPLLQYLSRSPLSASQNMTPNESLLVQKLTNAEILHLLFKSLLSDTELKASQTQNDVSYLSQQQPKRIYSNGHKLINYILDANPKKLNLFLGFIDNFSNYPICFYHRLFRKMMILGGPSTVQEMKKLAKTYIVSQEKEQVKLCQFLLSQILPFCPQDEQFYAFYSNYLVTCSKQDFQFANGCLLVTFCIDWKVSKIIFNKIIESMRQVKGPSRLRHLQVFNNYLICAGRFAQQQAKNGIKYLMKGIEEGTDQVSELIVSMLIYCFIIPININLLPEWVLQSQLELFSNQRIYKLDSNTAYEITPQIRLILSEIVSKTNQQVALQSKNLKVYSNIAYKILSNITVYRFNNQFYNLFQGVIFYILNKGMDEGSSDFEIVEQLKDSEYPSGIYEHLIEELLKIGGCTPNVQKKKLRYLESVVINRIYCTDQVNIPDVFANINDKNVSIDLIVAASNMARIMKDSELTAQVQKTLQLGKSTKTLMSLMSYLLAAGTRDFQWRQKVLNQILSFKKNKIVKQFISYWWKGRTPETERQNRLCMLVRSVENPYSYFA